jgi:hypothetical protein
MADESFGEFDPIQDLDCSECWASNRSFVFSGSQISTERENMDEHRTIRRSGAIIAALAAMAMLVALLPTTGSQAADHLDAPGLTPPGGEAAADIADLYAFEGSSDTTVIALTLPALTAEAAFGGDVFYEVKIDTDGDAVEDESHEITFSDVRSNGAQFVVAQHASGEAAANGSADGDLVGFGQVGKELALNNGGTLWAGKASDPFFFDLQGFLGSVEGADNDRMLNDGNENDFFDPLDVLAVVIEVPDYSGPVNIWATTSDSSGDQIDRLGRPAINTVVNSSAFGAGTDKNVFNQAEPADDVANFDGKVEDVLMALSGGDTEGAYTTCQADVLAGVLLPDVLPFDKSSSLPAPLEGRALADDVIDTELRVITGGDPLDLFGPAGACPGDVDRDPDGAINTDGIDAHTDYQSSFPYLGEASSPLNVPELTGDDFIAKLDGINEVPDVQTNASGVSSLEASGNTVSHLTLGYQLEGAIQAHIHVGDPDENGPVVAFLYGPTSGENFDGMLSRDSFGGSDLTAGSLSDLTDAMNGGFAYVNVHTTDNPAGEIRGQIRTLDDVSDAFVDDDDSVHQSNIDLIAASGITIGCNPPANTEFCPDDEITRGQMAAFLDRGLNLPTTDADHFDDDGNSIFEDHINSLGETDITRGCNPPTNTLFCPEDSTTRGQTAAFIVRAWDLPATDTDYFDDDDGSTFENDINALAEAGVTLGCNPPANDNYCPERTLTRAEMASFLARAFGW